MKHTLITTLACIAAWFILCGMTYLCFAAISADFNLANWSEDNRTIYGKVCAALVIGICIMFSSVSNHIKNETEQ